MFGPRRLEQLVQVGGGDVGGGRDLRRSEVGIVKALVDVVLDPEHGGALDAATGCASGFDALAEHGDDEVAGVLDESLRVAGGEFLAVVGEVHEVPGHHPGERAVAVQPSRGEKSPFVRREQDDLRGECEHPEVPSSSKRESNGRLVS
jgi:hypothetical protein